MPPRLCNATLAGLPGDVAMPGYDRSAIRIGILHLGAGAFHRAHQAVYLDDILAIAPDWAISAVSLHSAGVRDALVPQDGLYTLALLDQAPRLRVIGAIAEVLCAVDQQPAVLARLADPDIRLVTLTITEKGYCLAGDALDAAHPDIVHDLAHPQTPRSAIGHLVAGLRLRHARGLPPYTMLSCDNLADNGRKLRGAVLGLAERLDPVLAGWIGAHASFPRSMVDSITPASDAALRARVGAALGRDDAWPVQREPYAQWVVEDRFCQGRPPLERAGVVFSDDIAGYDRAKLCLLNGAHSSLAYLGLLQGRNTVAEAMAEPTLAGFVETMMRQDIAPRLPPLAGFEAAAYIDAILARFANPAVAHQLAQIAWDGSQKIPVRLLGTIADALAAGRRIDRLCLPVAAWLRFVRRQAQAGTALVDPLAAMLAPIGLIDDDEERLQAFLALDAVFAPLSAQPAFVQALREADAALGARAGICPLEPSR